MTFKITTPGLYRCDEWGCQEKIMGDLYESPEGWLAVVVEDPIRPGQEWIKHRCPKCATKS